MTDIELDNKIVVRGYFVGQRLNLKDFEKSGALALSPLVIRAGHGGYAVLFRYGVAVLFGLDHLEEQNFISQLKDYATAPYESPSFEEVTIESDDKDRYVPNTVVIHPPRRNAEGEWV